MRRFVPVLVLLLGCVPCVRAADAEGQRSDVDKSVDKALEFLHNQQNPDGSWNVFRGGKSPAITSFCVMAFLSAGHVPGEGKHGDTVTKCITTAFARSCSPRPRA